LELKTKSQTSTATPPRAADYAVINAALERHLDLAWSAANQNLLKRKVGPKNFSMIQEIISFSSNQDAWLNAPSLSAAGDNVGGRLTRQYPLLSPTAILKIINQASYGWR